MRYVVTYKCIEPYESTEFTYPFHTLGAAQKKYSKYVPALQGKIKVTLHSGTKLIMEKSIDNYGPPSCFVFTGPKNTEKILET